jgi:coenzyme F420-reducing hydrogenase alpha subunit
VINKTGNFLMSKTITIDPVTRIEGHSKITIQLDDQGRVAMLVSM